MKLGQKPPFASRLQQQAEAWHHLAAAHAKLKPGIVLSQLADFTRRDLRHVACRLV
jgi:hypothetical protein